MNGSYNRIKKWHLINYNPRTFVVNQVKKPSICNEIMKIYWSLSRARGKQLDITYMYELFTLP